MSNGVVGREEFFPKLQLTVQNERCTVWVLENEACLPSPPGQAVLATGAPCAVRAVHKLAGCSQE